HVEVYSERGVGTTFKVYLPSVASPGRKTKSVPGFRAAPTGSETVLLVEDEQAVRMLSRHVLRNSGYTVLEAGNGEEALRVRQEYPGPIHLLVTDVVMPGMSGRELAEQLLASHPEMRV